MLEQTGLRAGEHKLLENTSERCIILTGINTLSEVKLYLSN